MKRIVTAAFALLLCANANAAFVFSDIPWNTPAETVVKRLKAAGFKQIRKDKQGDYNFHGTLLGHDASGVAMISEKRLVRVMVMLSTPDDTLRDTYNQVRAVLLQKYGPPARTVGSYVEPFHEGDGYEAEAIRSGKGIFVTQWTESGEQLTVNIAPSLTIAVTYESQNWIAERERRKNKGSAAF